MGDDSPRVVLAVTSESTAKAFLGGVVDSFVSDGWRVSIVASASEAFSDWAAGHGATAYSLPFARQASPTRDLRALATLTRWLRRQKPVAVVAATPKAGLLGMVSARITRVPVRVYQVWGLRLETVSGWQRKLLYFLEKTAVSSATHVLANSPSLADELVSLGIARPGTVEVLGHGSSHGVDIDRFSPDADVSVDDQTRAFLDRTNADLTVCYVGRLHPDKGINTLIDAARICFDRGVRVRLVMVGRRDGWEPEQLPAGMQELVHFVGPVPDPRAYMLTSDVLCLPTRREGFPNVVLEASALGVPTITTQATGAVDSVVDGETGFLVPVDDSQALAERFEALGAESDEISRLGRAARERVVEHFQDSYIEQLQCQYLREAVIARTR